MWHYPEHRSAIDYVESYSNTNGKHHRRQGLRKLGLLPVMRTRNAEEVVRSVAVSRIDTFESTRTDLGRQRFYVRSRLAY